MAVVMTGVDPHEASPTAVAINAAEQPLGQLRVRASAVQAGRLPGRAQAWPKRAWAVQGAGEKGSDIGSSFNGPEHKARDATQAWLDHQASPLAGRRLPCAAVQSLLQHEVSFNDDQVGRIVREDRDSRPADDLHRGIHGGRDDPHRRRMRAAIVSGPLRSYGPDAFQLVRRDGRASLRASH